MIIYRCIAVCHNEILNQFENLKCRLDQNQRHLFDLHTLVFDKGEQILCFQEKFHSKGIREINKKFIDQFFKCNSLNKFLSTNVKWTQAPETEACYSDWIIVIKVEGIPQARYSAHRYILGARSGYFTRVFAGKWLSLEVVVSESHVDLHCLAHDFFPRFLDYLYNGRIEVETPDAITALWLADYFDVPDLVEELYDKFFPIRRQESFALFLHQVSCLNCINLIEKRDKGIWETLL